MRPKQPRPGMAHHRLDLLQSGRGIAVDRAVAAGGFARLERAGGESLAAVGQQGLAGWAEFSRGVVVIVTESPDEQFHGAGFALHPP